MLVYARIYYMLQIREYLETSWLAPHNYKKKTTTENKFSVVVFPFYSCIAYSIIRTRKVYCNNLIFYLLFNIFVIFYDLYSHSFCFRYFLMPKYCQCLFQFQPPWGHYGSFYFYSEGTVLHHNTW